MELAKRTPRKPSNGNHVGYYPKEIYQDLLEMMEKLYLEKDTKTAVRLRYDELDVWKDGRNRNKEKISFLVRTAMSRRGWKVSIYQFAEYLEIYPIRPLTPADTDWKRMSATAEGRLKEKGLAK